MHPEFAPIAFISAFSLFLALPWHWRARNVATLSIIAWLFVTNIIYAVDAIIWSDSVAIVGLTWCDITVKLIIGGNFALPAACLCVCLHLEQVSSVRTVQVTAMDKRRRQIFEACMCFGLPMIFMALHYVVQGHRFDIIEDYGCRPSTYYSIPGIFIVWVPPLVMATASLILAGLALRHFIRRRITFAAHLSANHSALTTSRYLRLLLMSVLQMIWSIAITIFTLWSTSVSIPIRPYTSWAVVHSNFSRVDQFTTLFTPQVVLATRVGIWWMVPASTFAFVAFFAFGNDAMTEYKKGFRWIRTTVLRLPRSSSSNGKTGPEASKFPGAISLASFDVKAAATPPSPATAKREEAAYDTQSIASSSVGPALSYHTHPEDRFDFEPETPSSYAPTTLSTPAHAPMPPPGDLQFSPPRSRNLTGDVLRPYTYPSLDASHHAIGLAV
ncbi:Pheromone B beta 1 receptor [Mycena sanguinolenta]|uniref:Pheromone B beta 1 receptor n=1 Tax=Mycena sanguinolenta TaxID=230812 RepID=A0A8H6WRE6_9AGAR|nr:Pheromone B beta 1 receptor [Mycena sanguinolenta]